MASSKAPASKSLDEIVGGEIENELRALENDLANAPDTEDFADAFRFENAGDQLVGQVVNVDSIENKYGEYPVITVLGTDGEMHSLHGLGTILKRELLKAHVGSLVAVKFLGEANSKDGSTYKNYKVIVRKG